MSSDLGTSLLVAIIVLAIFVLIGEARVSAVKKSNEDKKWSLIKSGISEVADKYERENK
jgi:hypothetical protein